MVYLGLPAFLIVAVITTRDLLRTESDAVDTVVIAAVSLFSALFVWLALIPHTRRSDRFTFVPILVLGVIAIGIALLGSTTAVYLAVLAAMAGDSLVPRVALPIIVAAGVMGVAVGIAHDFEGAETLTNGVVITTVGLFPLALRRLSETNNALVDAREEVARLAVVDQRLRFARDLHDLLGHSLTVIRAKSELASRLALTDVDRAAQEMDEVEAIAREALAEVRETVTGYRRPTLAGELAGARTALGAAAIELDTAVDVKLDSLPADVDETLGWVLREAVTNVVRHSAGTRCRVAVHDHDAGNITLEVTDDGRGAPGQLGHGLSGARERLELVDGTLEVGTSPDRGCRLLARAPVRSTG
jgi:two-component system, NarL family, sensor histidine kinase DesK